MGGGWTQLVTLVAEDKPNPPHAPLGRRLALPDGVAVAYLRLLSITSSLTLLSGTFVWNDVWGEALDRIAKRDYPTILPPGGALYGPFFHKQLEARIRRRAMRRHVSSWLTDQIPGAFAELSAELPAIDVITSAWARPFQEDPPLGILDYREALALGPRHSTAFSPALPGWTLALDDPSDRHVLTLAGRTVEVFDDRSLKLYGGVSRGGMASFLWLRIQDLACSWATLNLMSWLHSSLASTRDRAPEVGESPSAFARRISRDLVALRRGNDAATVCSDLLELPSRMGPLRILSQLDFVLQSLPGSPPMELKMVWSDWLRDHADAVRRLGREQQAWLATSAQVSGLGANIRLQQQLWILAVIAVVLTLTLGILQLTAGDSGPNREGSPTPTLRVR